jgi:hypothetical protein
MRRQVRRLEKLDPAGLRWRSPMVDGRVVAVLVGARRMEAGDPGWWIDGDRVELVAPAEEAYGVIESP